MFKASIKWLTTRLTFEEGGSLEHAAQSIK
jgi:hypothetical protein